MKIKDLTIRASIAGAFILFISLVSDAKADSIQELFPADILYHGLDLHKCEGTFKSYFSPGGLRTEATALNPFVGVRLNDVVSLHLGYFHMDSGPKRFISNTASYPEVRLMRHRMRAPHIDVIMHTPIIRKINSRLFVSAGLMPAKITADVSNGNVDNPCNISPMAQRYNFFRFGVGAMMYVGQNLSIRGSFTFLKPKRVTLEPVTQTPSSELNGLMQRLKNSTHVGVGLQYEWQ